MITTKGGGVPGNPGALSNIMTRSTNKVSSHTAAVADKGSHISTSGAQGTHAEHTMEKLPADITGKPFIHSSNQVGGASSAWRNTNYSRGPVNYPRNGWSNGQKMFRQFSKNATYIPNDKLAHSVAPISTGLIKDTSPVGSSISGWANSYADF